MYLIRIFPHEYVIKYQSKKNDDIEWPSEFLVNGMRQKKSRHNFISKLLCQAARVWAKRDVVVDSLTHNNIQQMCQFIFEYK